MSRRCPKCGRAGQYVPKTDGALWLCARCRTEWAAAEDAGPATEADWLADSLTSSIKYVAAAAEEYLSGPCNPSVLAHVIAVSQQLAGRRDIRQLSRPIGLMGGGCVLLIVAATIFGGKLALFGLFSPAAVMVVFFAGVVAERYRQHSFRVSTDEALRRILLSRDDVASFGAMATSTARDGLSSVAARQLRGMAHKATAVLAAAMTSEEISAVARLLDPVEIVRWRDDEDNWVMTRAAIAVLSGSSYEGAVARLRDLAGRRDQDAWWHVVPSADLREQAREAADRIEARLRSARDVRDLLRASTASDPDIDSLLRPAEAGEEPRDQLLRPAEGTDR